MKTWERECMCGVLCRETKCQLVMKKRVFLLFLLATSFCISGIAQVKKPSIKTKKQKIHYTWNGKAVTYKQYRDSLRILYLKFCDSLQKVEENKRKPKESPEQHLE